MLKTLVIIGELTFNRKFNAERIVALVGSSVEKPRYFKTRMLEVQQWFTIRCC